MTRRLGVVALALIVVTSGAFAAMAPKRIVTAVDPVARTFGCHANKSAPTWTYKTTNKTVIRVSGQRARVSHLWHRGNFSDIKVGGIVAVRYHLDGSDRIAERVVVYPAR